MLIASIIGGPEVNSIHFTAIRSRGKMFFQDRLLPRDHENAGLLIADTNFLERRLFLEGRLRARLP